jgi:hypothetical protein
MKRKRLPPPVEQPPKGMIWNPSEWIFGDRKFIYGWEINDMATIAMRQYDSDVRSNPHIVAQIGISELHKYAMLPWNVDPSYSWRRHGPRSR